VQITSCFVRRQPIGNVQLLTRLVECTLSALRLLPDYETTNQFTLELNLM